MAELFRKEVLHIDTGQHSWQEAIRITGNLMLKAGAIEEDYIQAMINSVLDLGPYIVIAPQIAIAHAAARTGVIKNDMVLSIFKEPVIFNSENDPVHIMLGLCALEPGSHLEQMTVLAEILDIPDVVEKFLACETVCELYDFVNQKST